MSNHAPESAPTRVTDSAARSMQEGRLDRERAASMAKMAGRGTHGFDMALDEINHVKVPWYDVMQEYFVAMVTSSRTGCSASPTRSSLWKGP